MAFTFTPTPTAGLSSFTFGSTQQPSINLGAQATPFTGSNNIIQNSTTKPETPATSAFTVGSFPTIHSVKTEEKPTSSVLGSSLSVSTTQPNIVNLSASTTLSNSNPKVPAVPTTAPTTQEKQKSFKEMEDSMERWRQYLEEQEASFLNQADQVNSWDKHLIDNGIEVECLNKEVNGVIDTQDRLTLELDFILSQQNVIEDILLPIEEQVRSHQFVLSHIPADAERFQTYSTASSVEVMLNGVMEDMKEVINRMNLSNVSLMKTDETVGQIGQILNSHISSLHWVEQNTATLRKRIEQVNDVMTSHNI